MGRWEMVRALGFGASRKCMGRTAIAWFWLYLLGLNVKVRGVQMQFGSGRAESAMA